MGGEMMEKRIPIKGEKAGGSGNNRLMDYVIKDCGEDYLEIKNVSEGRISIPSFITQFKTARKQRL